MIFACPLFWVYLVFQIRILHFLTNAVSFHPRYGFHAGLWTILWTIFFITTQIITSIHLFGAWDGDLVSWHLLSPSWKIYTGAIGFWGIQLFLDHPVWALIRKKPVDCRLISRKPVKILPPFKPPMDYLKNLGMPNQVYLPEVFEYEVKLPGWPKEFSGLTLVQLSDIHYGKYIHKEYLKFVFDAAKKLKCDLLVFTGDFISFRKDIPAMRGLLKGFRAPMGVYALLGNHDHWANGPAMRKALEEDRIHVLVNEIVSFKRKRKILDLMGVDDLWTGEKNIGSLLNAKGDAKILLAHQPAHFPLAKKLGAQLQLSGHCHGGQICFPIIGPVIIPSPEGRKYVGGFVREGKTTMFVHRGLGCYPPLRTLCPPEIVKLTLRPE
jgi:hypothetical protein